MGLKEDLQKLSMQIAERKNYITNEETTKHSLIIPFLQVLGYDIFNPIEVRPEYVADFGKKKGEKVDYAIFKDNNPIVFLEAKSVTENLNNHDAQLSRYFNAVPDVKLAILTNGIEYRFYTDLDNDNMMDEKPFYIVDMLNIKDSDVETLVNFKKDSFNKDFLIKYAEELVYTANLNNILKDLLREPSDDFIRLLIKDFSNTRITNTVIDRFKPIVKKAIYNAILDIVNKGLSQQTTEPVKETIEKKEEVIEKAEDTKDENKKGIITTPEELEGFEFVKTILQKNGKDIKLVNYKDTVDYFGIFNKNSTGWFIRLYYNSEANKHIALKIDPKLLTTNFPDLKYKTRPSEDKIIRIEVSTNQDLHKFDKVIAFAFDNALV